jgi:hypothetical protein
LKTIVSISKTGTWEGMPSNRTMHLEVRTNTLPAKVMINGKVVKISAEKEKSAGKKTSCTYDEKWLHLIFTWDGKPLNIEILNNR